MSGNHSSTNAAGLNIEFVECWDAAFVNSSWFVAPPVDVSSYDDCFYTNTDPAAFTTAWTEDAMFWPVVVTYAVTFSLGVGGSLLVVVALAADRQSVTAAFLVSLAAADLAFLLVCLPYDVAGNLHTYWAAGTSLCKIAGFVEILSAAASVLNLVAVSMERYIVIVHPMKSRSWCTLGTSTRIILSVWVVAAAVAAPQLFVMETSLTLYYSAESHVTTHVCSDGALTPDAWVGYAWYQLIVLFLAPLVAMLYCYIVVIRVLWVSTKQLARMTQPKRAQDGDGSTQRLTSSSPRHYMRRTKVVIRDRTTDVTAARKQVIRMLLAIIGVFFICWGPKLVFNVMKKHQTPSLHTEMGYLAETIIRLLPYIQSCTNPVIYCFMSHNFRKSLRTTCHKACRCITCGSCSRRSHPQMDFDMDTKSANGRYTQTSPGHKATASYVTVLSE